jgi:heptaprenylglyceryl phosphate synthase
MFDPDHFRDVSFFRELARIGYRQVLLGGTGAADLPALVSTIKAETELQVVLYPGGPSALAAADLVVLPDVMNSNSHYARPFGSGSVATATNILQRGLPFLPVAYFIMGNSTAGWFYDAFRLT